MAELMLYDYWRSSAAYRVRIALNLKGLAYRHLSVHLAKNEQHEENYRTLNPMQAVPMLVVDDLHITQSLNIIDYLEEIHPQPSLLPPDRAQRTVARAMAQIIACDVHPLNNLRTLRYLSGTLQISDGQKQAWIMHWNQEALHALEAIAKQHSNGRFCVGNAPSIADACLIPQIYNARRFHCPLDAYPTLTAIDAHCRTLPAFDKASPENHPDAEPAK